MAATIGVVGLLSLVFFIHLFTAGHPSGTLNDICIGLAAILRGGTRMFYPQFRAQSSPLSQAMLVAAMASALVVTVRQPLSSLKSLVSSWRGYT